MLMFVPYVPPSPTHTIIEEQTYKFNQCNIFAASFATVDMNGYNEVIKSQQMNQQDNTAELHSISLKNYIRNYIRNYNEVVP